MHDARAQGSEWKSASVSPSGCISGGYTSLRTSTNAAGSTEFAFTISTNCSGYIIALVSCLRRDRIDRYREPLTIDFAGEHEHTGLFHDLRPNGRGAAQDSPGNHQAPSAGCSASLELVKAVPGPVTATGGCICTGTDTGRGTGAGANCCSHSGPKTAAGAVGAGRAAAAGPLRSFPELCRPTSTASRLQLRSRQRSICKSSRSA
jgi:hypothetical protein